MLFKRNSFFNTTWVTVITSFLTIAIATGAQLGWIFGYEQLKSFSDVWATMKFNTAAGIIFSAASILLFASGQKKQAAFLLAGLVFLLGAVTLC